MTGSPAGDGAPDLRRLVAGVRAVLFDLDGVLVDTEPWWPGVRVEWAAARGLAWTADDSRACMGRCSRERAEVMRERHASFPPGPGVAEAATAVVGRLADLPIADLGGDGP